MTSWKLTYIYQMWRHTEQHCLHMIRSWKLTDIKTEIYAFIHICITLILSCRHLCFWQKWELKSIYSFIHLSSYRNYANFRFVNDISGSMQLALCVGALTKRLRLDAVLILLWCSGTVVPRRSSIYTMLSRNWSC